MIGRALRAWPKSSLEIRWRKHYSYSPSINVLNAFALELVLPAEATTEAAGVLQTH